mmetsp:Transcript_131755/g.328568  ORF Transcript_131755/g.328568 Transcript_131755/m.328568 type:complete len:397 (-) Transcript_131755:269-1459(-)
MMAPSAFPTATGIMFPAMSKMPTSAPTNMPSGKRNIFAMECSRPSVTNVMMGSQSAAIFAAAVCAEEAWKIATFTSQFAQAALPTMVSNGSEHFLTVSAATQAAAGLPTGTTESAKTVPARKRLPARLPMPEIVQMRQVFETTCFCPKPGCVQAGSAIVTKLPVSSSEPDSNTMERPTGNTAPVSSERRPGASARTVAVPPATTVVRAQPQPRRAPPRKELQKIWPVVRWVVRTPFLARNFMVSSALHEGGPAAAAPGDFAPPPTAGAEAAAAAAGSVAVAAAVAGATAPGAPAPARSLRAVTAATPCVMRSWSVRYRMSTGDCTPSFTRTASTSAPAGNRATPSQNAMSSLPGSGGGCAATTGSATASSTGGPSSSNGMSKGSIQDVMAACTWLS